MRQIVYIYINPHFFLFRYRVVAKCAFVCGTTINNTIKQYNSTIYTKYEYFSFLFFFPCLEDSICSSNMTVPSSLFLWIFWFKTLILFSHMNDPKWTINIINNNNKLKTLDPNSNCNYCLQVWPTHHVIETLA